MCLLYICTTFITIASSLSKNALGSHAYVLKCRYVYCCLKTCAVCCSCTSPAYSVGCIVGS